MAKILGISGSPRNKSTEYALGEALKSIESRDGIETSMITLRGKKIAPCNGCGYCKKNKTWCCLKDDFEPLLKEFMEADAYLLCLWTHSPAVGFFQQDAASVPCVSGTHEG